MRLLSNSKKKPKSDDIKINCNYSTLDRNTYVKGGITARDEMCQIFLMFYPKNPNLIKCKETKNLTTWNDFLISLNK